jgi:hypothetical protein
MKIPTVNALCNLPLCTRLCNTTNNDPGAQASGDGGLSLKSKCKGLNIIIVVITTEDKAAACGLRPIFLHIPHSPLLITKLFIGTLLLIKRLLIGIVFS